jgi:hypothetical protein
MTERSLWPKSLRVACAPFESPTAATGVRCDLAHLDVALDPKGSAGPFRAGFAKVFRARFGASKAASESVSNHV